MARPKPYNPVTPLTPKQLRQKAGQQVTAALTPERQAIIAAQKAAQRSAAQQQQRIAGFSQAAAGLLGQQLGPTADAYNKLIGTQQGLATGFSQGIRERLANVPGAEGTATADAVYALSGYVPGQQFSTNAAAAYADAVRQPATQLGLGQLGLRSAASTYQEQNRQYLDKLVAVAGKRPGLYQTALDALQRGELQKLATRADLQAIGFKQDEATYQHQKDFASLYGYNPVTGEKTLAQKRLEQQISKAQTTSGKKINATLSKTLGHLVYTDGTDYLVNGKQVKVPKEARTSASSRGGTWAERHPYQAAVADAAEIRGKPQLVNSSVASEAAGGGYTFGKYVADPRFVGHKGGKGPWNVFPPIADYGLPPTTNNPRLARTDSMYNLNEAVNYIMEHYGLSQAKARQALAAGGWFTKKKKP